MFFLTVGFLRFSSICKCLPKCKYVVAAVESPFGGRCVEAITSHGPTAWHGHGKAYHGHGTMHGWIDTHQFRSGTGLPSRHGTTKPRPRTFDTTTAQRRPPRGMGRTNRRRTTGEVASQSQQRNSGDTPTTLPPHLTVYPARPAAAAAVVRCSARPAAHGSLADRRSG